MIRSESFAFDQAQFERARMALVPGPWRNRVSRLLQTKKADDVRAANLWLVDSTERMGALRVPLTISDSELCEQADRCAAEAFALAEAVPGIWCNAKQLRERMARYCIRYGIDAPAATVTDTGAIARMSCPLWWRRKLRASQARALEREAIALGYVHKRAEIYASDVTTERRRQQKARNAATLESVEAVNTTTGEIYQLAELAARAVSNPRIRRGELMTRISGFEAVAKGLEHAAEFWTATCPSRMHPKKTGNGGAVIDNPKFDGTSPRQAQEYLTRTWANFRAAAWRRGLRFYGFRIAEPHHDATPHWHLLLFMPRWVSAGRSAVSRLRALFRRYFLKDSATEAGAKRNRCEFVAIDWTKGSAAGYVAKYVSKNIDGYNVQADLEGEGHDAVTSAERVEAWASTWGIRQFQQVGGPNVGAWRELRRMGAGETSETVEQARSAADTGNWARYVEVQGGPTVTRRETRLRVAYTRSGERWNVQKGEAYPAPLTRYGEPSPGAVFGVLDVIKGMAFVSRIYAWEIRARGERAQNATAAPSPWSSVNNCSRAANDERGRGGKTASAGGLFEGRRGQGAVATDGADHSGVGGGPDS